MGSVSFHGYERQGPVCSRYGCCVCDCVHKTLVVCMPYFGAQGNLSPCAYWMG